MVIKIPPPPALIMLIVRLRMVKIFCSPISFKHMSLWYPFLDPHLIPYHLKCRCLKHCYVGIKNVWINVPRGMGTGDIPILW
jgi:hypothetical protein